MSIALPRAPLPLVPPLPSAPAGIGCIVTLGGVTLPQLPNLYVLAGTMSIVDAINQRTTCTFHVVDVAGVQHFQQGMRLQVTDGSGTILFGGFVANAIESRPGSSSNTMLHAITGMDYHYLADKRIVATSYAAGTTCGAIVQDLITNWLASEGITVGGIQPGPALSGTVTYNYKPASYVLDQVAQFAGFSWFIDASRRLWFFKGGTFAAPWTFDGTAPGTYEASGGTSVEHYNKGYRNSQYVLGATEVTATQTEAHKGDGSTRAFALGYPIHQAPSNVNVNGGAAQTVGVQGSTTGKQWYWTKGSNVLQQDSSGTILAGGTTPDTLNVTYVGQYEVVAYAQDQAQVNIQQALEGVGTGTVEEATVDTKLTTASQAFQEAAGLLNEYSSVGTIVTFKTTKSGLLASQMLPVSLGTPHSLSGNYLIEKVELRYEPNGEVGVWWYHVTATQGPISETWVQWFTRIVQPPHSIVDVSSLGQQSYVALLNTTNETWTWTENVTETVTACPVFPMTFPKVLC